VLIGRIDKFVTQCAAGPCGYLVVEAEAGMGKTAPAGTIITRSPSWCAAGYRS